MAWTWLPIWVIRFCFRAVSRHGPPFAQIVAERFLAVNIFARLHRVDRGDGVPMVWRGDDHAVEILAVKKFAVVVIAGRVVVGRLGRGDGLAQVLLIDIGERDHVNITLAQDRTHVAVAHAAAADNSQIDFFGGCNRFGLGPGGNGHGGGQPGGGRLHEMTA